jgi:hypothetical protein
MVTYKEWIRMSPEEQDALIASGWHPGPSKEGVMKQVVEVPEDQMDAAGEVLVKLEEDFPANELPGKGDLKDAIEGAGFVLGRPE